MTRKTLFLFAFFVCCFANSTALAGDASRVKMDSYTVVVDYDKSLEQMVIDGNYDWYNDYITGRRVPIEGKGKVEVKLYIVSINRKATTKEVEIYLDSLGLQLAKAEHLCALGAKFPELQRKYTIITSVSTRKLSGGARYVIFLEERDHKRYLGMDYILPNDQWESKNRFLAVSK